MTEVPLLAVVRPPGLRARSRCIRACPVTRASAPVARAPARLARAAARVVPLACSRCSCVCLRSPDACSRLVKACSPCPRVCLRGPDACSCLVKACSRDSGSLPAFPARLPDLHGVLARHPPVVCRLARASARLARSRARLGRTRPRLPRCPRPPGGRGISHREIATSCRVRARACRPGACPGRERGPIPAHAGEGWGAVW